VRESVKILTLRLFADRACRLVCNSTRSSLRHSYSL